MAADFCGCLCSASSCRWACPQPLLPKGAAGVGIGVTSVSQRSAPSLSIALMPAMAAGTVADRAGGSPTILSIAGAGIVVTMISTGDAIANATRIASTAGESGSATVMTITTETTITGMAMEMGSIWQTSCRFLTLRGKVTIRLFVRFRVIWWIRHFRRAVDTQKYDTVRSQDQHQAFLTRSEPVRIIGFPRADVAELADAQ